MPETIAELRDLPSVTQLAQSLSQAQNDVLANQAAQEALIWARAEVKSGHQLCADDLVSKASEYLASNSESGFPQVINLTGTLLHTGLGRARLAPSVVEKITEIANGYSATEFNMDSGQRGYRTDHVKNQFCELTGAESAFVVNNCAGAVILALSALARGKRVILSRGQMIEIGGSYRMPDIIKASGCELVEVGCTNKTHLKDYQEAMSEGNGVILRCHQSNFSMIGFTDQVHPKELSQLAHQHGSLCIDDLGSGCMVDTTRYHLPAERTLRNAIDDGADVVMASGDKLLGGPQAGILVGKAEVIKQISQHPLARALRVDKLTLAGLQATLSLYQQGREREIPLWQSLSRNKDELAKFARQLLASWHSDGEVLMTEACIGGGALPQAKIESRAAKLVTKKPSELLKWLRQEAKMIGREEAGCVFLDVIACNETDIENARKKLEKVPSKLK